MLSLQASANKRNRTRHLKITQNHHRIRCDWPHTTIYKMTPSLPPETNTDIRKEIDPNSIQVYWFVEDIGQIQNVRVLSFWFTWMFVGGHPLTASGRTEMHNKNAGKTVNRFRWPWSKVIGTFRPTNKGLTKKNKWKHLDNTICVDMPFDLWIPPVLLILLLYKPQTTCGEGWWNIIQIGKSTAP